MSLQTRLGDFVLAVGTDYKQLRVWLTGSASATLASLNTTDKTSIVAALNEVNSKPVGNTPGAASETQAGVSELATNAETLAGTLDQHIVTPLKLQQKLTAWAQPLSANLTTLAGLASGAFGRTLLGTADAAAAKTALGLSAVATSGSASDITTGTLPASVMPPIAINDTFVVASQTAMLALVAQRGDIAVRSDIKRNFVLAVEGPTVLANWVELLGTSDVTSVAGRTGAVVLAKTDVGLSLVDNTADASKPVSTAQATSIATKLTSASNLSDVPDKVAGRTNLDVYSKAEIGNPETDLVAAYATAKA